MKTKLITQYTTEDQGKRLVKYTLESNHQIKGSFQITLNPGCHELELKIFNLLKLLEEKK